MFTLYTTPLSANGRKVLAVSRHLDLHPEVRSVNVYRGEGHAPEYLAINPSGRIPALVEGDFVLLESNAILAYLAEAHGEFRLHSRDPKQRADIASWLFWESAHWQPALTGVLSSLVGHRLVPEAFPAPPTSPNWRNARLRPLLDRLEAHLGGHEFLAAGRLSIADFSIAGMMTYFRTAVFPFREFPNLTRWYAGLEALAAWRETAVAPWK